jgi:hypothetical protein
VTRLRATLRGLLDRTGRLASKLVGGSWTRGTLGSPGRLNHNRNWNRSRSVSSSFSSNVSSTMTVSSPSLTSRRSLPFLGDIYKSGRRSWLRDKLYYVILQQVHWVSTTTTT